jgi:hypothetical protein
MSQVEVDKIIPQSGTTLTIGDSGDTIAIASGATLSGSISGITNLTISGDLTVDTNTLYIDSTNNRVGIGTTSPATNLQVYGNLPANNLALRVTNTATDGYSTIQMRDDNAGIYRAGSGVSAYGGANSLNLITVSSHNIAFSTSNQLRMLVNGSGNVGIGTSSPSSLLNILGTTADADGALGSKNPQFVITGGNANNPLEFGMDNSGATAVGFIQSRNTISGAQYLSLNPSGGNVGIGTSNPSGNLHINSGTTNGANTLVVESDNTANSGGVNPQILIRRNNTGATRLGGIYFQALNSASSANAYAVIEGQATSDTAGSEGGYLRIGVQGSGSLQNSLRINSDATINFQQSGGGIYLGTTSPVSANLLDDYEEGTFTPTFTSTSVSFSYSNQYGFYTKIGRSVTCHIFIRAQSSGTTSNSLFISGLPFTSLNSSGLYASGSFGQIESIDYPTGALEITGHVSPNDSRISLQYSRDDSGALGLPASAIDGTTSSGFMFSINYFTDA